MRIRTAIVVASLSAVMTAPALAAETRVELPGCEYSVLLPAGPELRTGQAAQPGTPADGPSQVAELRDRIPAYRVECQPLTHMPPNAETAMLNDLDRQAEAMGLADPDIQLQRTRLGTVGRLTGVQTRAGSGFVVTASYYLGRACIFGVIATEPAPGYPAEEVRRVFDSVSLR